MLRHLKYGTTEHDWFRGSLEEARKDPVGLWAMVSTGRAGFGLSDGQLERFVSDYILYLLQGGAVPVVGDRMGWKHVHRYGQDPQLAARAIVSEWQDSQSDPDVDGLWFVFPSICE